MQLLQQHRSPDVLREAQILECVVEIEEEAGA